MIEKSWDEKISASQTTLIIEASLPSTTLKPDP